MSDSGGDRGRRPEAPRPEELHFYYNRERRLTKSSPDVRWLAERQGSKKPGFFAVMFASRASRLLFLTILALAAAFNLAPLFEGKGKAARLGAERYSATAIWYEGRVLAVLRRFGREGGEGLLTVEASAQGAQAATTVFPVGESETEEYRLSLDSPRKPASLRIAVSRGGRRAEFEARVE